MNVNLPENTRVIDLIRFAQAQGKRLVWRRDGLRYRPHMEDASRVQHRPVTRLRPRLRVVDCKKL